MAALEILEIGNNGPLMDALEGAPRIGLDTEFMREKTFFAQLCLVQVAANGGIFCADPLVDGDLQPFWSKLMTCTWVVHSGRQDIEVVFQTAGKMPTALFDTQVAAALLGYPPQMGYATLVLELFDVALEKSHTRADWSRRPLSQAAIEYAAEDVEYLLPAYGILSERLRTLGRLDWAEQDSADLLNRSLYESDPQLAIERLKGARNLQGAARAAAAGLAAWREREALLRNRPRQWIIKDTTLLDIAVNRPGTKQALDEIAGMPARTVERAGDELVEVVRSAAGVADEYEPPGRPDEKQKAQLKEMQRTVSSCAEELGIAAEVVAPKKDLASALAGDRRARVFRGWRRQLVGERLLEILGAS